MNTETQPADIQLLGKSAAETIAQINACKDGVQKAVDALGRYAEIGDDETRVLVGSYINRAKKNIKQVQDIRLGFTRQVDAYKNRFMDAEKRLLAPLNEAIATAEAACNAFVRAEQMRLAQERRRIEEQRAAEIAAAQEKAGTEGELVRMEAEFRAQAAAQQLAPLAGVAERWRAVKDPGAHWDEIVAHYVRTTQDETRLGFLLDFLVKNGRPEIEGVSYIPEHKHVSRA